MKGTSFTISPDKVEETVKKLLEARIEIEKDVEKKVGKAVEIVYRTATAKRPMITPAQAKAEGRKKIILPSGRITYKRVSDPNAKLGVPVDTGELKASIKKEVKTVGGKSVGRIYTDKEYANAMEFGTSKVQARPFMRPALKINMEIIKRFFREK